MFKKMHIAFYSLWMKLANWVEGCGHPPLVEGKTSCKCRLIIPSVALIVLGQLMHLLMHR